MFRKLILSILCIFPVLVQSAPDAQAQVRRSQSILEFFGLRPAEPHVNMRKKKAPVAKSTRKPNQKSEKAVKRNPQPAGKQHGQNQDSRASSTVLPDQQVAEKSPNAAIILVVGDFMADGASEGLAKAFESDSGIVVVSKASGSSGFVRDDHYNWPEAIGGLISEVKPKAIAVMIGTNDRQQMAVNSTREAVFSPAWKAEYTNRVERFSAALKASGVPVVWIGMPPFRQNAMSADMLMLNDIYRQATGRANGKFVDVWEGFVDEQGAFITNGSDHIGQPARLRASDGINMTASGKRKIAFYAEKPLREALGAPVNPTSFIPSAAFNPFLLPGPRKPTPKDIAAISRTAPQSLFDPAFDGASELLGGGAVLSEAQSPSRLLYIEGKSPPAVAGRIDQTVGP